MSDIIMIFKRKLLHRKRLLVKLFIIFSAIFTISRIFKTHQHKSSKNKEPEPQNKGKSFSTYVRKNNLLYSQYRKPVSSYKCLGKQNVYLENDRRGCIFKNVCYRASDKKIIYYNPTKRPVFYDKNLGPLFGFGDNFISMSPLYFFRDYFSPVVEFSDYPTMGNVVELSNLHVYWSRKQ